MRGRITINAAATVLLNNAYGMLGRTQDSNFANDICIFL